MMLLILQVLFIVSAVVTALGFVFVYQGWRRAVRTRPQSTVREDVTVVVAAHNEARRIPHLLDALARQRFPSRQLHVIVVDDRSDDGTAEAVCESTGQLQLELIRVDDVPVGVSPKKYALHRGISAAATDIILLTDADCEPEEEWVAGMLRTLQRDNDVAVGLAPLRDASSAVSAYAAFDARRSGQLMTAAAAWGVPYMATGRSWGFRKAAYTDCGGLEPLYAHLGGDDDLLLQRMHASGARVGCCTEPDTLVFSDTPRDWRALYRQKLRHYRVGSAYRGRGAALLGVLIAAELLAMLSGIALTVALPGLQKLLPPLLMIWTLWYVSGFQVAAFTWTKGSSSRWTLVKWEGFHIFYSVIVSLLSQLRPSRWQ